MIQSYKELTVWQRSFELVVSVYDCSKRLPREEIFGLVSQMRRAAVAIPSNIAEGRKRSTRKEFVHFLRIADGSAAELDTQLLLAKNVYPVFSNTKSLDLLEEVQKMLSTMIRKLQ